MKLRVIEPCEQGWANMEPRAGGRFCERCDRTVIDFTRLSVRQAEARVRAAGERICGHALVHAASGEAVLRPSPGAPRWLGGLALGAALSAGCAGPGEPPAAPETAVAPEAHGPPLEPVVLAQGLPLEAPQTRAVAVDAALLDTDASPDAAQRTLTARKRALQHPPPAAQPPGPGYMIYDGMMDFVH